MNTLTQQQINQSQWQVADGVARVVNPFIKNGLAINDDTFKGLSTNNAEDIFLNANTFFTNAPDGIYSGEAFEEPVWQIMDIDEEHAKWDDISQHDMKYYGFVYQKLVSEYEFKDTVHTRQFLRLKPSHLPAVLTSQPGKGWKDRYRCYIKQGNVEKECRTTNATFLKDKSLLWRLNDVTPPAEQEAETFKNGNEELAFERFADELNSNLNNIAATIVTDATWPELISRGGRFEINTCVEIACNNLLQSTLTPKDQRIAELERMLDQCQKNDLYFEQEKEQLNNRIAELEREREWVSVHEFDESTLPIVGKSVIGIVDYMRCGIDKRDYIVCYMGEEKETRLLADDDYYGWDFDECIAQWVYLDMPLKPIF